MRVKIPLAIVVCLVAVAVAVVPVPTADALGEISCETCDAYDTCIPVYYEYGFSHCNPNYFFKVCWDTGDYFMSCTEFSGCKAVDPCLTPPPY